MALPVFSKVTTANTQTLIYTVPDGKNAVVTINVVGLINSNVTLSFTPGIAPTDLHYIENKTGLQETSVLERTGIIMAPGNRIYAMSNTANAISVQVWGYEENVSS